jgi:protein-tyrosine phosphatase
MKILMVCLGNICRSPLAEGILTEMIARKGMQWEVDSAGTGSWHIGEAPHKESIKVAQKNGIDISQQRARQFSSADFDKFDLILAMDAENYNNIVSMSPNEKLKDKVKLILNYSHPGTNMAVPDPYFTGGFDNVYHLLEEACKDLIKKYKQ